MKEIKDNITSEINLNINIKTFIVIIIMETLKVDDIYFIFTFNGDTRDKGSIDYYKITEVVDESKCKLIIYKRILLEKDENDNYYIHKQYDIPHYDNNIVRGKVCKNGSHDLSIQYQNDRRQWVSGFSIDNLHLSKLFIKENYYLYLILKSINR